MNENNDLMILDAIERYIRGEMTPDERLYFENLRKSNSEIDQLVVEHTLFLQQINRFGEWQQFRAGLNEIHSNLAQEGDIQTEEAAGKGRLAFLWTRYKRIIAIAASIAGITAIGLSVLVNSVTPTHKDPAVKELVQEVNTLKEKTTALDIKIDNVDRSKNADAAIDKIPVRFNGTGFLIDPKGLMISNAHIVKNSRNIYVENNKGQKFKAIVLKLDVNRDVAIIKIDDDRFKPFASLPYGIRKTSSDLAESIYTLGFPRNDEIVYGKGYLSARTGFNGDTLSCQISVDANPGNSGGPVFNHDGEVIGILTSKETQQEGAVFAVQSKYIYQALEELKGNVLYKNIKLSSKSSLKGLDETQQVKKIQDCVFMVKGD